MTCHEARDWFSGSVDDVLTPQERARLDTHLRECGECRRELCRLSAVVDLLHRTESPRAPAGFVDRVLEASRRRLWPHRAVTRLFVPASVKLPAEAAAVLMVATLAVFVFHRTPELQQGSRHEVILRAPLAAPASPPLRELREAPTAASAPPSPSPGRQHAKARPKESSRAGAEVRAKVASPAPAGDSPFSAAEQTQGADVRKELRRDSAAEPRMTAPALSRSGPNIEEGAEAAQRLTRHAPAAMAPFPSALRVPPPEVVGLLVVKDPRAAEQGVMELVGRTGTSIESRREESGATVLDLAVPNQSAYLELIQGLGQLGAWTSSGARSELPDRIRVRVRLAKE